MNIQTKFIVLYETFLVFTNAAIDRYFFSIGFNDFCGIMTKSEKHQHDFFFEHFLMTDSVLIHFISCVNKLPASVSRDLTYSVSLSLPNSVTSDLTHRLGDRHFYGMQDADKIESDGTSDSKLVTC